MRALLAFDKFKGCMTAAEACEAAASVLKQQGWLTESCPLSDGGEGFCQILTSAAHGSFVSRTVRGPRGDEVTATIGLVDVPRVPKSVLRLLDLPRGASTLAVLEMAQASGLSQLTPALRNPWKTSSWGTGELIREVTEMGVDAILLGVGGSATNDLGLGALEVLGLEGRDDWGSVVPISRPEDWHAVHELWGELPDDVPPIRIACDVANPLLGETGCTASYGLQKGLRPEDLPKLEAEIVRMSSLMEAFASVAPALRAKPGAGAAGGIAFGLMACLEARLVPGFELVREWLDLDARILRSDLVLTGEGRFDDTSLQGKGPAEVARRAAELGKRSELCAGAVTADGQMPFSVRCITPSGMDMDEALRTGKDNLCRAVAALSEVAAP